jgi:hypothetical protein
MRRRTRRRRRSGRANCFPPEEQPAVGANRIQWLGLNIDVIEGVLEAGRDCSSPGGIEVQYNVDETRRVVSLAPPQSVKKLLALDALDPHVRESHIPSVCLQPKEARMRIDAWRIPADRIACRPAESRGFLAVEPDDIVLTIHLNLIPVPLTRRQVLVVLVILLPGRRTERLDLVNGSRLNDQVNAISRVSHFF